MVICWPLPVVGAVAYYCWPLIGAASTLSERTERFDRLVRVPSAERTSRQEMDELDDTKRCKMRRNSVANGGAHRHSVNYRSDYRVIVSPACYGYVPPAAIYQQATTVAAAHAAHVPTGGSYTHTSFSRQSVHCIVFLYGIIILYHLVFTTYAPTGNDNNNK